jgi:predicted secreted hydrolase
VTFPNDEGIHSNYSNEWWYLNLNLKNPSLQSYRGFIAIMRQNVSGVEKSVVFMELGDVKNQKSYSEVINGTLKAETGKLKLVFNGKSKSGRNYSITWTTISPFNYEIVVKSDTLVLLDLVVASNKIPLMEGEDGIVPIGPNVNSYYYTLTNLSVKDKLLYSTWTGTPGPLSGKGWFDHQWFNTSSYLSGIGPKFVVPGVKHEWFDVQLSNGNELVFWQINFPNGSINKYLGILDSTGKQKDDYGSFTITPLSYWTSPSGKKFANKWSFKKDDINITITTQIPDQTLKVADPTKPSSSLEFYEGGTTVTGIFNGQNVNGSGYAEMTKTY